MNSVEGHDLSVGQLAVDEGNAELDQAILVEASCHEVALGLDLGWSFFPHK